MKKMVIILSVSTIIISAWLYLNFQKSEKIITSTGGKIEEPIESEIKKGEVINQLRKSLPLRQEEFTITRYDYGRGKFIVSGNRQDFADWLESSEFTAIPPAMFAWE